MLTHPLHMTAIPEHLLTFRAVKGGIDMLLGLERQGADLLWGRVDQQRIAVHTTGKRGHQPVDGQLC